LIEEFVKKLVDGMPPNTQGLKLDYYLHSKYLKETGFFSDDKFTLDIPANNRLPFINNFYFDRML
jgi:hypothetical protein